MHNMKILSIIPARGGSKGLKRKNIYPILGKPLINYSIEASLNSKYITHTAVTSEDEEILTVAEKAGSIIVKRPQEFSTDYSTTEEVILDTLRQLGNEKYDYFVLLQPTSPLRSNKHIDEAFAEFFSSDAKSLISVFEPEFSVFKSYKMNGVYLEKIFGEYKQTRRQDLPVAMMPNGAIYISNVDIFRETGSLMTDKTIPFIMSVEDSIDIDVLEDVKRTEKRLIKVREYEKKNSTYS